jgi:hypothetical protein
MLINKTEDDPTLDVNGEMIRLDRYEVRVIDTPALNNVGINRSNESSEIDIIYSSSGPLLQMNPCFPTKINIQVFNILGRKLEDYHCSVNPHSIKTVNIFRDSKTRSSGIYFVTIRGTNNNSVKRFYWLN